MTQSFSICPAYSGVSKLGWSACPDVSAQAILISSSTEALPQWWCSWLALALSSSAERSRLSGHTIPQLSLWIGAAHAYGQSVSVSLVCGGPSTLRGGRLGAASTSWGPDWDDDELGHENHESTSDSQRPVPWPTPTPSQIVRRM